MEKKTPPKTTRARTAPKKKAGLKKPGRDKTGKFVKGHKVREKWTEETVLAVLDAMWKTLTTDPDGNPPPDGNLVRANDIKLLGEVCLKHSVSKQQWNEWEDKFAKNLPAKEGEPKRPNPYYSPAITDLIKNIKWCLECRLVYSGTTMDIFNLKVHYQYRDQVHIDTTTKGQSINNPFYEFLKATSNPVS